MKNKLFLLNQLVFSLYKKRLLMFFIAFSISDFCAGQSGSLDLTFDTDGKQTTNFGTGYDYGKSVAIQSDGKIVVAGSFFNGVNYDYAIVRYNIDGSLDNTFDTDGKQTTAIGSADDFAESVAIQTDGKIVVVGTAKIGINENFAIVRYNSNGSLDNTFDTDGIQTTTFGTQYAYGTSAAIQSDGKIVMAGYASNGVDYDFAIVRYNSNGSLDNTLDSDGKQTTAVLGASNDYCQSVAIQIDGKIVLAGYSFNGANDDFATVRYNSDGSLDNTFDTDGKQTTNIGLNDKGNSVAIQSDGKIVVAGRSNNGGGDDFAIVRYDITGTLDNTFDTDGKQTTDFGSNDQGYAVVIQSNGKIVMVGYANNGANNDFAIVRYNSNGLLDNTFDTDGKQTTAVGASDDFATSVAIQSDGKIVVAGYTFGLVDIDFAIVRYLGDLNLGIENLTSNQNVLIFPNPFSVQTTFHTDNFLNNATLTVLNSVGQQVKKIKSISGQTVTLFRNNLPSGLYFIRLTEGNKIITANKLVITDCH